MTALNRPDVEITRRLPNGATRTYKAKRRAGFFASCTICGCVGVSEPGTTKGSRWH